MKFNALIPELAVADLEKSLRFYRAAGFKVEYRRRAEKFAFLSRDGAQLMVEEASASKNKAERRNNGIHFQITVKNIERLYQRMKKAGSVKTDVYEKRYRTGKTSVLQRQFWVEDPDGYKIRFAELRNQERQTQKRNKK